MGDHATTTARPCFFFFFFFNPVKHRELEDDTNCLQIPKSNSGLGIKGPDFVAFSSLGASPSGKKLPLARPGTESRIKGYQCICTSVSRFLTRVFYCILFAFVVLAKWTLVSWFVLGKLPYCVLFYTLVGRSLLLIFTFAVFACTFAFVTLLPQARSTYITLLSIASVRSRDQ